MCRQEHIPHFLLSTLVLAAILAACRPGPPEPAYIPRTAAVKLLRESAEAFAAGDTAKARVKINAALEEDPGYYLVHSFHSLLLGHEGETAAAEEAMQKALAIEPDFGKGHLISGVFQERLGNEEAARAAYARAIEIFDAEYEEGTYDPEHQCYRAVAIYLTEGRVLGQAAIDQVLLAHREHPLAAAVRENMRSEARPYFLEWAATARTTPAAAPANE